MPRATSLRSDTGRARGGSLTLSGAVSAVALVACAGPDEAPSSAQEPVSSACGEEPTRTTAPASVVEVVERLNAMPKPISLACFVESLPRPLAMHASQSTFSAQPALGARSPRIFLFSGPLILTVVPEGAGRHLMEIGELRDATRSLKAEIEFPVDRQLELHEPFERILFIEGVTDCAFCHADEAEDTGIDFATAFVSQALRPKPEERVSIEGLGLEAEACDHTREPERCALLDSLFHWGEVLERNFPTEFATFP